MYKILILLILAMGNLHATDDEKKDYSPEDRKRDMDRQKKKKKSDDAPQPKIGPRKEFKIHTIHDELENQEEPQGNTENRNVPYKSRNRQRSPNALQKASEKLRKKKEEEEMKKLEKKRQKINSIYEDLARENELFDERGKKLPLLSQRESLRGEIEDAVKRWNRLDYKMLSFKRMTDLYAKENKQIEVFKKLLQAREKKIEEEEKKIQKKEKKRGNLEEKMKKINPIYENLAKESKLLDEREEKLPLSLQGGSLHNKIKNALEKWNDINYNLLDFEKMTGLYAKENTQIDDLKRLLKAKKTKIEEEERKLKTAQNKSQLLNDKKKKDDKIKTDILEQQKNPDLTQEQIKKEEEEEDLHHRTNLTNDDSSHLRDNGNKDDSGDDDREISDLKEGKTNTAINAKKFQKSNVLYVVLISTLLIGVACVKFIEVINKKNKKKNSGKKSAKQEKNK